MKMYKSWVLIPAYKPDEKLLTLIPELQANGFSRILVVNDGSGSDYESIFSQVEKLGATLIQYEVNQGKGHALKTGFTFIAESDEKTCVTCDADGQHRVVDICKVAEEMENNPECLVLGVRDFTKTVDDQGNEIPSRSVFGNRVSSFLFKLSTGKTCPDTQTGLRGIPANLMNFAIEETGSRYEYEMNFLSDAVKMVDVKYVPITVIYEDNNSSSHFRPVRDSMRVYGRFLKFCAVSLTSALIDYLMFLLFSYCVFALAGLSSGVSIICSTCIARLISGSFNYYANRKWCFKSKLPAGKEAVRYLVTFFSVLGLSALFVELLNLVSFPAAAGKPIVDAVLFLASYWVQKNWVFKKTNKR